MLLLSLFLYALQSQAQISSVKLKGAYSAVFDQEKNSVYVATGKDGVWKINSKSLKTKQLKNIKGHVELITFHKNKLISIHSQNPENSHLSMSSALK